MSRLDYVHPSGFVQHMENNNLTTQMLLPRFNDEAQSYLLNIGTQINAEYLWYHLHLTH
jgi:hypothetical protein